MFGRYHELQGMDRYGENSLAGDLAEEKVTQVLEQLDRPVAPFGPRRVSTKRAQHTTWTKEIRHAPDFLGWGRFIEVQGSDGDTVIFKQDKTEALTWWDTIMPVFFGIYLQRQDQVLFCDIETVMWAISQPGVQEITLDAEGRYPKTAWIVPIPVLLDRMTTDAFAGSKGAKGKKKKEV
jgi:hypothetical protein